MRASLDVWQCLRLSRSKRTCESSGAYLWGDVRCVVGHCPLVCCLWLARWARPWPMFRRSVRPSTSARTWIELSLHAAISCDAPASAHEIARPHTPIGVVLFCLSGSWMRRWQTAHEPLKQTQSMMADTIYEETCISVRVDSSLQSKS